MSWTREEMCKIATEMELKSGMYINLGIGLPTEISNYIPDGMKIVLHSENGILGMGGYPTEHELDPDVINAGKESVTVLPYGSYFDSSESFAMIRGGHIDLAILGALQVAENGDIANWIIPGKMVKGMGGAMDLVAGVKRIVVIMDHTAKDGAAKLVKECDLPLTGAGVVNRVITNYGVFDFDEDGLSLIRIAPHISLEQIRNSTSARFINKLLVATAA